MKELEKYTYLSDEEFGRLVKVVYYYKKNNDIPNDIDEKTEILFETKLKKKCQYQINDTNAKRKKRGV